MFITLKKVLLDRIGIFASVACAIHCALLPLAATLLPLIGMGFLAHRWFELLMIGFSIVIGLYALLRSFWAHRNPLPMVLLFFGLLAIGIGRLFLENIEAILVPLGGLGIAAAHFANLKINRSQGKHQH